MGSQLAVTGSDSGASAASFSLIAGALLLAGLALMSFRRRGTTTPVTETAAVSPADALPMTRRERAQAAAFAGYDSAHVRRAFAPGRNTGPDTGSELRR